ncbi:MAG: thymidylate synthase [Candidatus Kerfeldbacteria bacterium]
MPLNEWPIYYADNLIVGNRSSSVGVATLWTPKEAFASKLRDESYQVMGQLYSNDGINPLLRNVLANPTLRTIVLCGQDKIGSADTLSKLIENGINEKNEVIGKEESQVEKEIPREAVELFRRNVDVVDMRGELKADIVQKAIDEAGRPAEPWAEATLYPEPKIESEWYPSEGSVYTYRGEKVADVWLKLLYGIMRFGEEKTSHYTSGTQRELLNVAAVITDECPDNINFVDYFPFTKEHFENYLPQVMTAKMEPTLSYTYGMRMRDFGGKDQIASIIEKLKKEPWSRRAVGVLWNVDTDDESEHPPCLNLVQAVVKYDKLHVTAYLRSNDMFRAWPENTLAFRTLQKEIADAIGLEMGPLTTISGSAHIYQESYVQVQDILGKHYPALPCEQDPRGNYVIKTTPEKTIEVTHLTPEGRKISTYSGKTAIGLFEQIASEMGVSVPIHAFDLGAELQKAEIANRLGIQYTQDRPLPYGDIDCKLPQ